MFKMNSLDQQIPNTIYKFDAYNSVIKFLLC